MSGYGQTGPLRELRQLRPDDRAALRACTRSPAIDGDRPRELGVSYADPAAGIFGAWLINAALIHRDRTGQGQYIDLSMLEAMEMIMPEALLEYAINGREPRPMGNHDRWMAPHNCYKARGDAEHWVTIAVGSEEEWRALCDAMGQPSLADDPRFRDRRDAQAKRRRTGPHHHAWTSERDRWEITEMLQRAGVAAIPTFTNKDLVEDRHMRERGFLVELAHPEVGPPPTPACPGRCRRRRARCAAPRPAWARTPTRFCAGCWATQRSNSTSCAGVKLSFNGASCLGDRGGWSASRENARNVIGSDPDLSCHRGTSRTGRCS